MRPIFRSQTMRILLIKKNHLYTNITFVRVVLSLDLLSKISGSNLVDEKKNGWEGIPTKGGQPSSPAEISYWQSQ